MELIKDYDISILYHPDKANMRVDALIQNPKSMESLAWLEVSRCPLAREVQTLTNSIMRLQVTNKEEVLAHVEAKSTFLAKIKETQFEDKKMNNIREKVLQYESKKAILDEQKVFM